MKLMRWLVVLSVVLIIAAVAAWFTTSRGWAEYFAWLSLFASTQFPIMFATANGRCSCKCWFRRRAQPQS